jgi:hypothetical protein
LSVAATKAILKRRVDEYLWRDKSSTVAKLRRLLKDNFLAFDRVAVIGGMVRDLARAGKPGFKSDIDLVVDAPVRDVETLAARLSAKPNRFGGYSYVTDAWKVDFWALHSTWAYREGHAKVDRLEDVTRCTFFDWDAVLYDVQRRQVVCDADYLDRIRTKRIEINLSATPSINGNLLRAVRRILLWDLEPGPLLHAFIAQHLSEASFKEIALTDRALHTHSFISNFVSVESLREHIGNREKRKELATVYARQLELSGLQPR